MKKNGGYFVNGKLSWADLVFVGVIDYLNYMSNHAGFMLDRLPGEYIDIIASAENLKALREKVLAEPKIKAWYSKCPKADF